MAEVEMLHVPYRGSTAALPDILAGLGRFHDRQPAGGAAIDLGRPAPRARCKYGKPHGITARCSHDFGSRSAGLCGGGVVGDVRTEGDAGGDCRAT